MGIKYLDKNATGAGTGLNPTDAWTTFTAAYAGATALDVVMVSDATYDAEAGGAYFYPNTDKELTFTGASSDASGVILRGTTNALNVGIGEVLTFNYITFDGSTHAVTAIDGANVGVQSVTLNNCIVTGPSCYVSFGNTGSAGPILNADSTSFITDSGVGKCIIANDMTSMTLVDCTFDARLSSAQAIGIEGLNGRIEISGGTLYEGLRCDGLVTDTFSHILIHGVTVISTGTRYGIRVLDGVGIFYLEGCTVSAAGKDAVSLGEFASADVQTGFGSLNILDNNISSASGSALAIEFGCDGGEITGNQTEGTTHSFKVTGDDNNVHGNICLGVHALVVFGDRNRVIGNTIVGATGTWPLIFGGPQGAQYTNANGWYYTKNNICYNNIVVSTDATFPAYTDYEGNKNLGEPRIAQDAMNDYMDYNCYWNTAGALIARIGVTPTDCATIVELQTAWGNAGTAGAIWNAAYYQINDLNSLAVNPQLDSSYKPRNTAVITGGKPDINGNATSIGAIPTKLAPARRRGRYSSSIV